MAAATTTTNLLSLPPELRQQILTPCLPSDVHNAGVAPRTAPLLPLLLTCKTIRLDVLELLAGGSWSPLYHIEDPHVFFLGTLLRRRRRRRQLYVDDDDGGDYLMYGMRRVSLRLFADLDLRHMRHGVAPLGAFDEGLFDVGAWLRCVGVLLPRRPGDMDGTGAVESVVLDLTPAPVWMVLRRPDWVRATVLDARNKLFLEGCADGVRKVAAELLRVFGEEEEEGGTTTSSGSSRVSISLGGMVPCKARRVVETDMEVLGPAELGDMNVVAAGLGRKTVPFAGEWIRGPADEPARLSLVLVCLCLGVDVKSPLRRNLDPKQRAAQVRNEARKEGLTTPDLDFAALGEVRWSKNSCTAYHVNAEADERRTREELTRILSFAVGVVRTTTNKDAGPPGAGAAVIDFEPAIRARRFLLHCLARDLGLTSVSIGDAGEKFVRVVSRPAEASSSSLEERGRQEMAPESLRAMQLRRAFRRVDVLER